MKRLIRAEQQGMELLDTSGMIELDKLSEADVRHDRCVACGFKPLKKENGFKCCPNCNTVYKVLNGIAYIVKMEQPQTVKQANKAQNVIEKSITESDLRKFVGEVKESCMSREEAKNFKENGGKSYQEFLNAQEPIMVSMLWQSIVGDCSDLNINGLDDKEIEKTMKAYLSRYNYQKEMTKEEFNSI